MGDSGPFHLRRRRISSPGQPLPSNSPGAGSLGFVAKLSFSGYFLDRGSGISETSPRVDKADPWVMAQPGPGASACG